MIVARRRGNIGNIIITAACCTFCVPVTCRPTLTEAALTDNFRVIRVHLGFILSDFMPSSFGQFVFSVVFVVRVLLQWLLILCFVVGISTSENY